MNKNDFNIINENTISFKNNKLYVMLLRELGVYGVEVASKTDGFGRKFAEDKEEATKLFEAIVEKLSNINNFEQAETKIKSYFSLKDINEIIFLLESEDVVRSQVSIGDLYASFKLKVKSHYDTKGDEYCLGYITIYVFFNNKRKPLGRFIGKRFSDNFVWETLNL